MSDLIIEATDDVSLSIEAIDEREISAIRNPAFVEVWAHGVNETVDKAVKLGVAAPGSELVINYNPVGKGDLKLYLVPFDTVGKTNISRLSEAKQLEFSLNRDTVYQGADGALITPPKDGTEADITAGSGAGDTPTVIIAGTNLSGKIKVQTGVSPDDAEYVVRISLQGLTDELQTRAQLFPANDNAAVALAEGNIYVVDGLGYFDITPRASAPLSAKSEYIWNYFVTLGEEIEFV